MFTPKHKHITTEDNVQTFKPIICEVIGGKTAPILVHGLLIEPFEYKPFMDR